MMDNNFNPNNNDNNRNYNNYNNQIDQYGNINSMEQNKNKTAYNLSVASLVLGIISLVFSLSCCCTYVSIIFSVVGLVLGLISKDSKGKLNNLALAGIICSSIAIAIFIIMVILAMIGEFNPSKFKNQYDF
ncbi:MULTISPECIES: DUF4190 domain-containing protein [unclassified Clostridium]|uniref:DUF4190 domain-containing protein n=1 Tax=unclassified Clostridium TaxID=2614128 RepID=UPI0002977011|nr:MULTISPECIES: DUF4190 domain-containing protein [unclassified Clostridium]EKQ56030.1 MAG: hypothetical protein A370_02434 [Clostridium sp. Maddingley MBC34-26]